RAGNEPWRVVWMCGCARSAARGAGDGGDALERGRYLVDTIMTCHNCHTPMGPNGPQFNKALSGGMRCVLCIGPVLSASDDFSDCSSGASSGLHDALQRLGDFAVEHVRIADFRLDVGVIERTLYELQVAGVA